MAAPNNLNNDQTNYEHVVNRWLVDYYSFLAVKFFKNEQYEDFCNVRNILDSVLARPMESTDDMSIKIRILQFLSRLNEGEKLDLLFDSDQSLSPLESALLLLEDMQVEFRITVPDFESVCTSLKEMIVATYIRKNEFEKAREQLNKHFPKAAGGKRAVFMGLICHKNETHEVLKEMNFQKFKAEMLVFCQRLCTFGIPFLHKAAKTLVEKRLAEEGDKTAEIDEAGEPVSSCPPQIVMVQFQPCKHSIIQRARLERAYQALAGGLDKKTFAQLEQELETERQGKGDLCLGQSSNGNEGANLKMDQEMLFQRDAGSPMEASPADQLPLTEAGLQTQAGSLSKTLYTVARLVMEPDSQPGSQCTTAPEEFDAAGRGDKQPQTLAASSNKDFEDMECPVTDKEVASPTRKFPRKCTKIVRRTSTRKPEFSPDTDEESQDSADERQAQCEDLRNQSHSPLRRESSKKIQTSSESGDDLQLSASIKTPIQRPPTTATRNISDDEICITDTSVDSSPKLSPYRPVPQKSSTPHKAKAQDENPTHSKWKALYKNATESKDTWSDEESYFKAKQKEGLNDSPVSHGGHKKRKWTESETQKLKDGVKKFGEGSWSKIKAYYSFKDRTNVHLKDRWRTLKKLKMI
ncbi:telomeric repeat binding factor a [Menidia menidia]